LIIWHKITKAKGEERKKMIMWSAIGGVLAVIGLLAITGHLNIITAMIAGAVALLPRVMQLAKYLPFINRMYQQHGQQQRGLPQIAALTLGEEIRGVAGRPEGTQCSRHGDDLDQTAVLGEAADPPQAAASRSEGSRLPARGEIRVGR